MLVRTNHAAPIDEDGWRAVDFQLFTIGLAGVNRGRGFGAGHAALKSALLQAGLDGIVRHLGPGVLRGNDLLVVVNQVIQLPEGLGFLLIRAAAGDGCSARPWVELFERKILEDYSHLSAVARQEASQRVM